MVNEATMGKEGIEHLKSLHPLGRLGRSEEIAHGVVFLVENEFTTGHNLYIDGGYTAQQMRDHTWRHAGLGDLPGPFLSLFLDNPQQELARPDLGPRFCRQLHRRHVRRVRNRDEHAVGMARSGNGLAVKAHERLTRLYALPLTNQQLKALAAHLDGVNANVHEHFDVPR